MAIHNYPPIESELRPTVDTAQAAFYLGTKTQTLHAWSCYQSGPLKPVKVGRLLRWSVSDIKRLLGVND